MAKQKEDEQPAQARKLTATAEIINTRDPEDSEGKIKTGRKQAPINWDKVETAMAMGGDLKMCAMHGGVHWNTLERRILERYGENFREVRQAFLTDYKALALQALWRQVGKGNWRAIRFANVAFNNLNDRPKEMGEDDNEEATTFKLAYDPHEPPPIDAEYAQGVSDE